ncbi:MAG TPA: hypothetical protein DD438_12405 [Verrucomicrobiales bacterium]|nr:hypothetical protein [Verrucomicrobiales bacterium]
MHWNIFGLLSILNLMMQLGPLCKITSVSFPAQLGHHGVKVGNKDPALDLFQKRTAPLFEARFLRN